MTQLYIPKRRSTFDEDYNDYTICKLPITAALSLDAFKDVAYMLKDIAIGNKKTDGISDFYCSFRDAGLAMSILQQEGYPLSFLHLEIWPASYSNQWFVADFKNQTVVYSTGA